MKKANIHLILIAILAILFLILVLFSTKNASTTSNYSIKEEILITSSDYKNNIILGEATFENTGFLPARINIKNLVLCEFSEEQGSLTYFINFRGKTQTQYDDIFYSGNAQYIELSAKETRTLEITTGLYPMEIRMPTEPKTPQNKIITTYLYENQDETRYNYDFCSGQNPQDAFKTIQINIQIPQE